jgi:hypothetical protein
MTMPLGMLLAGVLTELLGLRTLLLAVALAYVATTLSMLLNPVLRQLNDRVAPPKAVAETAKAP